MKSSDTIGLVLKSKGHNKILSIAPEQSVYEAIEKMAEYNIGALLVLSEDRLVGILSEPAAHCGRVHVDHDAARFSPSAGLAGRDGRGSHFRWRPGEMGNLRPAAD